MALATVVHPALAPSRRILAVSDIHGNRAFFRGLLEKAAFSSRDILVLVGDILEKGPDSLGLLRDILELSQDHTILPVCGNCDGWSSVSLKMTCGTKAFSGSIFPPTRRVSCARWPGRPALTAGTTCPACGSAWRRTFPWVWDWLRSLPTILGERTPGLCPRRCPPPWTREELDAWHCMKNDDYWGQGHSFAHTGKYVVVGHWPSPCMTPASPPLPPSSTAHGTSSPSTAAASSSWTAQLNCPYHPGGVLSGLQLDRLRRAAHGPGPGPTGAFGGFPEHPLGPQPGRGAGAGTGVISVPPSGDWTGAPHPHQLSL